jgi:hypothetical protein
MSSLSITSSSTQRSFFDVHSLKLSPPLRQSSSVSTASIYGRPPWTDPWPDYDQLTEDAFYVNNDGEVLLDVYCFGYWHELAPNVYNPIAKYGRPDSIGNYSVLDIGNTHNHLCFYFDFPMNFTEFHYIKYYQSLGMGHTGNCYFLFFEFNDAQTYVAYVNYTVNNNGLFYRQQFNMSQLNNWYIDPQFDFGKIEGFMIAAEVATPGYQMWVDTPKFYGFPDPLPVNEVIDEAQGKAEIIDVHEVEPRTTTTVQMYHGNISSGYEHWLLKVYVEDEYYYTHTSTSAHPSYCKVEAIIGGDGNTFENPPYHYPQAGYVGSARTSSGLSYYGIGFSVTSAEKYISYSRSYENGAMHIEWDVEPSNFWGSVSGSIFCDYAEFAVGFCTPIGYKPWAYVYTEISYYAPAMPFDWWPDWSERQHECVRWLYVDPPGSNPTSPGTPTSISSPSNASLVCVNQVTQRDEFQQGFYGYLNINYTWGFSNAAKQVIDVTMYDSGGNAIPFATRILQSPPQQIKECIVIYSLLHTAGQVKIVVRILNDWPPTGDTEFARMEICTAIAQMPNFVSGGGGFGRSTLT